MIRSHLFDYPVSILTILSIIEILLITKYLELGWVLQSEEYFICVMYKGILMLNRENSKILMPLKSGYKIKERNFPYRFKHMWWYWTDV